MNIFYWIISGLFVLSMIYIFAVLHEQLYLLIMSRYKNNYQQKKAKITDNLPFVTIQLPIFNEGFIVERLLHNAFKINYPKELLEIQILDDSTDETSEIITAYINKYSPKGLSILHIKRKDRKGYKAGNLKNGLQTAKGEFIAFFDSDFIIPSDFLLETIKLFEQKNIAAVQTRWGHTNEYHSVLTRIQSFLINNHFLVEQFGRNKSDYMVQFSGTAGIWRKEAINDAGGWLSDTLIEDVDLSIRAQLNGWKILIRPDIVCLAELPNNIASLKLQQFRWMQGGAEVTRKHLKALWKSDFSFKKKYHGTLHIAEGYIYFNVFLISLICFPFALAIQKLEINFFFFLILVAGWLISLLLLYLSNYKSIEKSPPDMRPGKVSVPMAAILIISTVAISFHNSVALFKGTLGMKTPFKRTPKIQNDSTHSEKYTHKNKYSAITFFEISLAIYFLVTALISWNAQNYIVSILHVFFAFSYTAIALLSIGFELKFLNRLIR